MAIYPLEFYRRAEEKWRRRSESVRAAVTGSPSKKEGDDTLVRWPWLLAIGQGLQSEYAVLKKQPLPKRLAGLLKRKALLPPQPPRKVGSATWFKESHMTPATASSTSARPSGVPHTLHSLSLI